MSKPAGKRNKLPTEIEEIRVAFEKYVEETDLPIVAEFAYQNKISWTVLDRPELKDVKENCIKKKQTALERGALAGKLNPAMSIFSLKQLGWSDKLETKNSHDVNVIQLVTLTPEEYRRQQMQEDDGK